MLLPHQQSLKPTSSSSSSFVPVGVVPEHSPPQRPAHRLPLVQDLLVEEADPLL